MSYSRLFTILAIALLGCMPAARAAGANDDSAGDRQQVSPAVPSSLVDVLDADRRWPLYYWVPRADLPALIARKVVVSHQAAEGSRYRFASIEAAAAWFAAARPVVPPQPGARSALQELNFGVPMCYFNAGMTLDASKRPWFWAQLSNSEDNVKRQIKDAAAGKRQCLMGCEVLLVDRQQRLWVLPGHERGLLGYDLRQDQWIEQEKVPPEKPPRDPRDTHLVPGICGPAFQSRSGLLFFGDRMGVHVFDGRAWHFQKLYQRNIDEDRFFATFDRPQGKPGPADSFAGVRRFTQPSFSEDSEGRVYVWSCWGTLGEAGTIGFWIYDRGTWKNVDVVEHLDAVMPRDPGEIWLVSRESRVKNALSGIKGGRHVTGDEAQRMLAPNLRFSNIWPRATAADGTVFVLLEDVVERDSGAASPLRGLALRRRGPAVDLGNAAGRFLKNTWTSSPVVDPQGRLWGGTDDGLTVMSADGRRISSFPVTKRFTYISLLAADGQYVYFSDERSFWRLDPAVYRQSPDAGPLLPAAVVRIRGRAGEDALGRMWCIYDFLDSPTAVFDGKSWESRIGPTARKRPEEYVAAFRGVDGAMVFADNRNCFHLFDADGHVAANSAENLALQYGDRLRKALPYPPRQNLDRYHHLVKDAKGRIWWASGRWGWGVVDGKTAIRGEMDDLNQKVRGGRFTLLYPIGDGTRVLMGFQAFAGGVSGVYDVANDRMVRLADSPVNIVQLSSAHWQPTARADSSGRVWVMRDRQRPGPGVLQPVSQAIDLTGKAGATHEGWLVLEDRQKGLWFRRVQHGPDCILRLDASGRDAELQVPNLTHATSFAEAPDGSVWTLTHDGLIRVRVEGNRLAIAEQYPMAVQEGDSLWCDREGRVWMAHTTVSMAGGGVHTELIRFATKP
jgi:ligand-binding sensor domain-containing protein